MAFCFFQSRNINKTTIQISINYLLTLIGIKNTLYRLNEKQTYFVFFFQASILDPAVLKEGDVPAEAVVRGLCKILPIVLPRYCDSDSRYYHLPLQ